MDKLKSCVAETTLRSGWWKISSSITRCRSSPFTCPTSRVVLGKSSSTACRTTCPPYPKRSIWRVGADQWRYHCKTDIFTSTEIQATKEVAMICVFCFLQTNFTHISYSLSLLTDPRVIGNIIRDPVIKIDYTCVFPYVRSVSLPFPVVPFSRWAEREDRVFLRLWNQTTSPFFEMPQMTGNLHAHSWCQFNAHLLLLLHQLTDWMGKHYFWCSWAWTLTLDLESWCCQNNSISFTCECSLPPHSVAFLWSLLSCHGDGLMVITCYKCEIWSSDNVCGWVLSVSINIIISCL